MTWNSVRAFIALPDLFNAHDAYSTVKVEEDPVVAYAKAIPVLVVCEGLDVPGLRQVEQFGAHCRSDLLPRVSVDLAQLTKSFGLPVDRVHPPMISEGYVLATAGN